ncbi:hypothetical protein HGRIS_009380 [Hohenbuehelia grisea]|uniref:Protein CPL1-like domain-containing protein n=1 Tax=Hohenbuehelia grisea TaxID=104357 RepID=A0ABR3J1B8_9AGAR
MMRSFAVTLAILAIFVPVTVASSLDKRRASDNCAYLRESDPQLGQLNSCFCASGAASYIDYRYANQNNKQRKALKTRLKSIIASNGQTCTYPKGTTAFCTQGEPCLFICSKGFTANQATRECECTGANKIVCNGRCRTGNSCTSNVAVTRRQQKRDWRCPIDQEICGVRSARGKLSLGWECLDTKRSLESCGGCVYSWGNQVATGRDCSAIKGVNTVSCVEGKCIVQSCRAGYTTSLDGSDCVPIIGFRLQEYSRA